MAVIKILEGSLPEQSAIYAGDNMTVKTSENGIRTYWMKEATVSVQKVSKDKKGVTFKLELRDGERVQASTTHKVFDALKSYAKSESNLNYLTQNLNSYELKKTKKERNVNIIAALIVLGLFAWIFSVFSSDNEKPRDKQNLQSEAYLMCRMAVESKLKAPSTAKFPIDYRKHVKVGDDDWSYIVEAYVDSQNSFGAMIRTPFTCAFVFDHETDQWLPVGVKVGE